MPSRSVDVLAGVARAFDQWQSRLPPESAQFAELEQSVARLQGDSGLILRWRVLVAENAERVRSLVEQTPTSKTPASSLFAIGVDSRISRAGRGQPVSGEMLLAYSDVLLADPTRLQFSGSSNRQWQVWLNGRPVHQRQPATAFQVDSDRFEADLDAGSTRIVVAFPEASEALQFHLRFRPASSSVEHERLARFVLQGTGNVDRGREIFLNSEKSLCTKCHRLDGQGGTIGPDLTGIGRRFSRIHLIESILEPSRTIAPSYETITVVLATGRVVTGVRTTETDDTLTLGDDQGKSHEIRKVEIDERSAQPRSTMPEGVEKRLSDREFLDLIAFLLAQHSPPR